MELSLHTLLTAMSWAGCGEPHLVFAGGARYVPSSATERVNRAILAELTEAGLTVGKDLDPDFERLLHVLDRPHSEYYAYVRVGDRQYGLLVAIRGKTAVVARQCDRRVLLDTVGDRNYPALLVQCLPPATPARFTPFSVAKEDFPGSDPEARWLDELARGPYHGMGHLHTARRPGGGKRQEAPRPVSYLDTEDGRIGVEYTEDGYLCVFPGTHEQLTAKLSAARATLD